MVDTGSYIFTFGYVNAAQVIALSTVLPALCTVAVVLRFITRRKQKARLGADDWSIAMGLIFLLGMAISLIVGAAEGAMGYPTPALPAGMTKQEALYYIDPKSIVVDKVEFVFQILMILAYGCIKVSITLFYRRVFVVHTGTIFNYASKAMLAILGLWTLTFTLIMIFGCGGDFWAVWASRYYQSIYCKTLASSGEYSFVISDLILDFLVILMPLPLVWRLHLSTGKKFAVTGIILLGASSVGASLARLILYLQILDAEKDGVFFDSNQNITVSMWWSLLEAGLALIAACLPTLSHLRHSQGLQSAIRSAASHFPLHSLSSTGRSKHQKSKDTAEARAATAGAKVLERKTSGSEANLPLSAWASETTETATAVEKASTVGVNTEESANDLANGIETRREHYEGV